MIPFAIAQRLITPHHLALFREVMTAVNDLPNGLTCHEVCEQVAKVVPGLDWVRGK
jgi:hypothetical protein